MKKLILLPLALFTIASPAFAMDPNNNNLNSSQDSQEVEEVKRDPFSDLPRDIQNVLLDWCYPPAEYKNKELFLSTVKEYFSKGYEKGETSWRDGLTYGYHGRKVPIHCYNLIDNKKPGIRIVGVILHQAYPNSFSNGAKRIFNIPNCNQIFLQTPEGLLQAQIKIENPCQWIDSCALSPQGLLAIKWSEDLKKRISFFTIDDVRNNTIDLNKNCHYAKSCGFPVVTQEHYEDLLEKQHEHDGLIFNLENNLIQVVHGTITRQVVSTDELTISILDIPVPATALSYTQIAKRLMLPTTQLKEELTRKQLEAPSQSNCTIQ